MIWESSNLDFNPGPSSIAVSVTRGNYSAWIHLLFTRMVLHLLCKIRDSACRYSGAEMSGTQGWPMWALAVTRRVTSRPTLLASEQTGRDPLLVTVEFLLLAVRVSLGGLTIHVKNLLLDALTRF